MNQDIDDREWLAQQLAMSREYWSPASLETDAREKSYRRIARALRRPPPVHLPAAFAAHLEARARATETTWFESTLMIALIVALGLCAAATLMRLGSHWTLDAHATGWLLSFAGCVGGSWLIDQWQRRAR